MDRNEVTSFLMRHRSSRSWKIARSGCFNSRAAFLLDRRQIGKGFGDGLAVDLVDKARIWAMPWIIGLMSVAVGFATPAGGGGDGTWTKVPRSGDPIGNTGPSPLEGFQGRWKHFPTLPVVVYLMRPDSWRKEENRRFLTFMSHTRY